jgi:hypothetical protein
LNIGLLKDWQSAAVAIALVLGDVLLHLTDHPSPVLDQTIPIIVGAYIGGRVAVVSAAATTAANGKKTP